MQTPFPASQTKYIETVDQFLAAIADEPNLLFRGQTDDWPLVPKILRNWNDSEKWIATALAREQFLFREFKRQAIGLDERHQMPTDTGDLLSIAQHHGLPTRLLDWTQNPLAALLFAVMNDNDDKQSTVPVVWQLKANPDWYIPPDRKMLKVEELSNGERITTGRDFNFFNPPKTMIFRPNHVSQRIRVQSGWFTVHFIKKKNTYPIQKLSRYKNALTKICVNEKPSVLKAKLNRMGVNAASLFPDLTNLSSHLEWEGKREFPFDEKKK